MLTKEQISAWLEDASVLDVEDRARLASLALLGLEREESRARVEAGIEAAQEHGSSVLADAFGAFPDLEPVPKRDERAERIGRAVLEQEGDETPRDLRCRAAQAERYGYESYGALLLAVADAMEDEA